MPAEHFDVVIIGAGLSGIGAACHLTRECPEKSFVLLEARNAMGGTWDLFRYPGIRSDSDMNTLGYNFKPWTNPKAIADGPSIRAYIHETAAEYGVDKKIRYGLKVKHARWSTPEAAWTLECAKADGSTTTIICNFILGCTGYYNYDKGYTPEFAGRDDFQGTVIHPQFWPESFDYTGKRVVVIGSGATAVTLVPSLTDKAAHVTMLQRSPTYVVAVPQKDKMAIAMRERGVPEKLIYRIIRTRNVGLTMAFYNLCRAKPEMMKKFIIDRAKAMMPNVDIKHFTPSYNPWDERLCAVPSGDMFRALNAGKASVVTDHIERFTKTGIQLKSGEHLEADVIVTATGLELLPLGGVQVSVDGKAVSPAGKLYYKGLMLEGVPNAGMTFGYTNASWTLKADLTSEYVCRLLKHMDKKGMRQVTPVNRDAQLERMPLVNMRSGYIQRATAFMPQQGVKSPWRLYQNYAKDLVALRYGRLDDGVLEFSNPEKRGRYAA
ncbi:MAG: flavin binding monooxygenase [Moraxellaceae bacterium]|jgi:cation diffusion facilitator CzcD-associated flavoprotein CzcO|nr:flavin binding monooxygenase [Moraxellaceae bacterium]